MAARLTSPEKGTIVTDPEILAQLNGSEGESPEKGTVVTNPKILAQLNEPESGFQTAKRYGKDVLAGVATLGQEAGRLPYNLTRLFSERLAEKVPHAEKMDFGQVFGVTDPQPSDIAVQNIAEFLPSVFLPAAKLGKLGQVLERVPKAGKYLQAALSQAIPQGAFAAGTALDEAPEEALGAAGVAGATVSPFAVLGEMVKGGSPLLRTAGRIGTGLGAGYLGHELAQQAGAPAAVSMPLSLLAGYLGQKGLRPRKAAQRELLEGISPESVKDMMAASRRVGLDYITPAEATGSPFIGAREGKVGRTGEGAKLRYQRGQQRLASEEKAINNLFETLYDDSQLSPQMKAGYEQAMNAFVPPEFIQKHMEKPVIQKAIKQLESDPAYRQALGGVPRDSFAYWDQVKKIMQDTEESALRGKSPKRYKASIVGDTRRSMVKEMDEIEPVYESARGLARRQKVREQLEKAFDKKEITGRNFYKAVQNKREFEKLLKSLKDFPEAQNKIKDMRTVFARLIDVPTARTTAALERTSMAKPRAFVQSVEDLANNLFGTKHDRAAVDLMTHPKWDEMLTKLNKTPKKEKALGVLIEAIGKATAQQGAQLVRDKQQ